MPLFRFHNRLVLFVHIPKTGGTSISKLLLDMGGRQALRCSQSNPHLPCTPQHFHAPILRDLLSPDIADLAFTVVRNPFERLASEYRMRIQQHGRDVSFDEWVRRIFARFDRNSFVNDNHIRPQSQFLMDGVRQFRFEETPIESVVAALSELGLSGIGTIPWERRTERLPIPLSPHTADNIRHFYQEDFRILNYSPDDLGGTLNVI